MSLLEYKNKKLEGYQETLIKAEKEKHTVLIDTCFENIVRLKEEIQNLKHVEEAELVM